jgi:hypothetical protein
MAIQHRRMVTKTLVGVAVIAGCWVGLAAPAGAEPNPDGESHPFGALNCPACEETAGHGGLEPGIREGLRLVMGG